MKKSRLFTPGPCEAPAEVLLELAKPIFHHRTDEFRSLFRKVRADLKELFALTDGEVIALTSSGTGGMEASVLNTVPPGKKALVISAGKWGERWEEICKIHQIPHVTLSAEYGKAVTAERVAQALAGNPDVAAVFTTLSETSTGVCMDVAGHAAACRKAGDVFCVVDAISGFLADELRTSEWGVDIVVAGSQKAMMLPPGLAYLAVGPRVWERLKTFAPRSYYFDLRAYRKSAEDDDTPYTSAHTLLLATAKACEIIKREGVEGIRKHIGRQAAATRAGIAALGMKLFSERPGNAVTCIVPPDGSADKIVKGLKTRYGITVAGGQGSMKGKIFRIGHIGHLDDLDTLGVLGALEVVAAGLGIAVKPGSAVAAAQEVFAKA
jgi:aspartate aminotransferase-like enzyme